MLPVIDMCNHHSKDANCDLRRTGDGTMVLYATQAVAPGNELLLNYGSLDNHTLLLDYGFTVQVRNSMSEAPPCPAHARTLACVMSTLLLSGGKCIRNRMRHAVALAAMR